MIAKGEECREKHIVEAEAIPAPIA
jgi:hypothetical protein